MVLPYKHRFGDFYDAFKIDKLVKRSFAGWLSKKFTTTK